MNMIEDWQRRNIYGMGRKLGIGTGNRDDNLHQLVEAVTGKHSISALTRQEAQAVIDDLRARCRDICNDATERLSGGVTPGQIKKIWRMMYALEAQDREHSDTPIGSRLCGIIKRELGVDATPRDPLRWLTHAQAARLIEALKGYVTTAERSNGNHARSAQTTDDG